MGDLRTLIASREMATFAEPLKIPAVEFAWLEFLRKVKRIVRLVWISM